MVQRHFFRIPYGQNAKVEKGKKIVQIGKFGQFGHNAMVEKGTKFGQLGEKFSQKLIKSYLNCKAEYRDSSSSGSPAILFASYHIVILPKNENGVSTVTLQKQVKLIKSSCLLILMQMSDKQFQHRILS